jgi:hypothetical protein
LWSIDRKNPQFEQALRTIPWTFSFFFSFRFNPARTGGYQAGAAGLPPCAGVIAA